MSDRVYERMLVAVDITADEPWVGERAGRLAAELGCATQVIHVLEPIIAATVSPAAAGAVMNIPDLKEAESERLAAAKRDLALYCDKSGLDGAQRLLRIGIVTDELLKTAANLKADLIVLGTHGRSGVARLLGSNASAVVHQAACDVLTVRLPQHD